MGPPDRQTVPERASRQWLDNLAREHPTTTVALPAGGLVCVCPQCPQCPQYAACPQCPAGPAELCPLLAPSTPILVAVDGLVPALEGLAQPNGADIATAVGTWLGPFRSAMIMVGVGFVIQQAGFLPAPGAYRRWFRLGNRPAAAAARHQQPVPPQEQGLQPHAYDMNDLNEVGGPNLNHQDG